MRSASWKQSGTTRRASNLMVRSVSHLRGAFCACGESELDRGAALRIIRGPELAAVSRDDRATDGEAHPHSLSLSREKWFEDTLNFFKRNAGTLVTYGHLDLSAIQAFRAQEKSAFDHLAPYHRVATIDDEVEQHL